MNDTTFDDCATAVPAPAPVSTQVPRDLLAKIEAALRTAADSAEERCIELCDGNPPRPQFIETLPLSRRRLAASFHQDCLHLRKLANDLEKLRR